MRVANVDQPVHAVCAVAQPRDAELEVGGSRDAENPKVLRALLRRDGLFLTEASEETQGAVSGKGLRRGVDFSRLFERVSSQEVAMLTRQLATPEPAGLPIPAAFASLVEQTESRRLRAALAQIRDRVNEGSSLADALAVHAAIFPELYVNMVRAGEASGTLGEVFLRLADFLESQDRLRGKILAAMLYPLIVMAVAICIVSLLMVVVVPKITQIFEDLGQALPIYTRLLIFVSRVTGSY